MCEDITIVGSPVFTEEPQRFFLASPIFIKRRIEEIMGYKYYFYDDQESNQLMTETLKHKMREAGLPEDDTLRVEFDISYSKKKKKMVNYSWYQKYSQYVSGYYSWHSD